MSCFPWTSVRPVSSHSTHTRGAQVAGPGIWRWDIVVLGLLAADLRLRREPLQVHNSLCPAKAIGQAWGHQACSPPGQVLASRSRAPGSSPPARLSAGPRPWGVNRGRVAVLVSPVFTWEPKNTLSKEPLRRQETCQLLPWGPGTLVPEGNSWLPGCGRSCPGHASPWSCSPFCPDLGRWLPGPQGPLGRPR